MRLNLKYNGLAWHVENDSSDITNEMYVYNTDGSLSHVVSDSNYTDYDGDGTKIFEETTSGCTFYKYIGAISEQICAIPLENNVFKLIAANQYSAPTIFNADKSKLSLDVALSQSKTIGDMYANFQDGVDTIYNAIVAEGVTPSSSTPEACATGISTVATNKYNTGYNTAQSVTWSQTLSMALYGYTSGFITNSGAGYSLKNVNSFTVNAVGGAVDVTIGDATTTVNAGSSRTFSSFNDTTVYFDGPKGSGNYTNVTVTLNYQAKILR